MHFSVICVCNMQSLGTCSTQSVHVKQPARLTGLWEFPSALLEGSAPADRAKRRGAINDYLRDTLELFPDAMSERRDIGDVSHTFSHIQMTLDVEMMSVKVRRLPHDRIPLPDSSETWTPSASAVMRLLAQYAYQ